jgi:hypothetical protein
LSSGKPGGDPGDAVDFTRWRGLSAGAAGEPARQWADRNVCPTFTPASLERERGCDGCVSRTIPRRELFFCLLSGRRIVRRADRNVCPTFTPASLERERGCDGCVSRTIPRRELFFCLLSGRRIVRRADRNVCPTLNTRSVGLRPIASLTDLNG